MNSSPSPSEHLKRKRHTAFGIGLVALCGLLLAYYRFGWAVLNPTEIRWFRGDSVWHFLTWHMFRQEPWQAMPGYIASYMAPIGANIGTTDALPLLAFPLKLLGPLLPPTFQYFGLWLYLNYALQAVFGYLLGSLISKRGLERIAIALLFLLSPIFIFRAGHIALSSQWLILYALWHFFKSIRAFSRRGFVRHWLLIIFLVGLVHPYLAGMVFPIFLVSLWRAWRFDKHLGWRSTLLLFLGASALLVLEWALSGIIFTWPMKKMWGFDYFNMNLNALFNPDGHARIMPSGPFRPGQYEGYAYLGIGTLFLTLFALVQFFSDYGLKGLWQLPKVIYRRGFLPITLMGLGFFVYAFGTYVALGNRFLFSIGIFRNFPWLTDAFRAPGRFIWPTSYLILMGALWFLHRHLPRAHWRVFLIGALLFQLVDIRLNHPFPVTNAPFTHALSDKRWHVIGQHFKTMVITPAFARTTMVRGDYANFVYLAANYHLAVTTGVSARPPLALDYVKNELRKEALYGPRDKDTIYVYGAPTFATQYRSHIRPGVRCHNLNAYIACYSGERQLIAELGKPIDVQRFVPRGYKQLTLEAFLQRYKNHTLALIAKQGVGSQLGKAALHLEAMGSEIAALPAEVSYIGVFHNGTLLYENAQPVRSVLKTWWKGEKIGTGPAQITAPRKLRMYTKGGRELPEINLSLDDRSVMKLVRGINVVVLDKRFEVVTTASFDTFVSDKGVFKP